MSIASNSSSAGTGLAEVLFVIFLVLKLLGIIAWSWWWVTAPLWIPALVGLGALLIPALVGLGALLIAGIVYVRFYKRRK